MGFTKSYQVASETGGLLFGYHDITGASEDGILWVHGSQIGWPEV
jgi:hypothetical protein